MDVQVPLPMYETTKLELIVTSDRLPYECTKLWNKNIISGYYWVLKGTVQRGPQS